MEIPMKKYVQQPKSADPGRSTAADPDVPQPKSADPSEILKIFKFRLRSTTFTALHCTALHRTNLWPTTEFVNKIDEKDEGGPPRQTRRK